MTFPVVRLGDHVSHVSSGATPKGGSSNYMKTGPVMFLRSQNVHMNELRLDDVVFVSDEIHQKMSRSQVQFGDVLINITGASIGRVSPFEIKDAKVNSNQHVCTIRPKPETLDYKFLSYFLGSESFQHGIFSSQRGGTREALNYSQIRDFKIPLPPLPEQKRIAAILDKADQLGQKRQQAISLADEFLRSVFLDIFGDPVTNPKGWEVADLSSLVKVVSGATPSKGNDSFWSGTFPWVSPKDMKTVEITDSIDHISETVFSETNLKRIPPASILIVVRGMILAHTVPVGITVKDVSINQDIKAFVCGDRLLPEFLLWYLKSQHDNLLSKVSSAAHGTKRFEMDDLLRLPVFIPEKELQSKFVGISKKFKKLSKEKLMSGNHLDDLFNSLSQKAFAGAL